jgi:hypothetical protein
VAGAGENGEYHELYPNPAQTEIKVHLPALPSGDRYTVSASDALGRVVIQAFTVTDGVCTVDVSGLSPGLYYLLVASDSGAKTTKFIVSGR